MHETTILELQEILGAERVLQKEPMSRHTTFRIGGEAEVFVQPRQADELREVLRVCRENGTPYCVIGNGSNLLVSDRGISGVVISLGGSEKEPSYKVTPYGDGRCAVTVWAGELLASFSKQMTRQGLTGLEWASGIPGTVGGALRMNAGAYDGCVKDFLLSATVLTGKGEITRKPAEALELSYRHSCIAENGWTVTDATFLLTEGNRQESEAKIAGFTEKRREKQPLSYPSAGSTFKRPEGYFAGKLVQDAGLRGYRVGDAQVSEKHCGFVINLGQATAEDVATLITDVQEKVRADFGVTLEPEIRFLGDFSGLSERVIQACHLPRK